MFHAVGPLVDPFRSHVSRSLFKGLLRETCQWLKFPLNGLRTQSSVSPAVGLLPLASGPACLGMAFPPFLVKQLYRWDSVVISSFVRTGCTARRWGWLLGRIGYSITHHYSLYPQSTNIILFCHCSSNTKVCPLPRKEDVTYSKTLLIPWSTGIGRNM